MLVFLSEMSISVDVHSHEIYTFFVFLYEKASLELPVDFNQHFAVFFCSEDSEKTVFWQFKV